MQDKKADSFKLSVFFLSQQTAFVFSMKDFFSKHPHFDRIRQVLILLSPVVALVIFRFIPEQYIFQGKPLCFFKNFFNFECPGCGMTRAFYCVVHFDFTGAWHYNKLVIIVFPLLSWLTGSWMLKKYKIFSGIKNATRATRNQ